MVDVHPQPPLDDPESITRVPPPAPPAGPTAPTAGRQAPERVFVGTGFFWSLLIGIILAVGVLIFVAQNTESVQVRWVSLTFRAPLAVLILGGGLAAIAVAEVAGVIYRRRRRRTLSVREELGHLRARATTPEGP